MKPAAITISVVLLLVGFFEVQLATADNTPPALTPVPGFLTLPESVTLG